MPVACGYWGRVAANTTTIKATLSIAMKTLISLTP
jgi:hypothetical protein